MASICPKCKFLIICDALHKDSIIECEDFENKQKTNADRIRAMTDEELAKLIHDIAQAEMWRAQVRECITTDGWLEWLKQEVN